MDIAGDTELGQVLGLEELRAPEIVRSITELDQQSSLLGIASALRRAFVEMRLSAVLLREGQPLAYIAELTEDEPYSDSAMKLQRQVWNQGLAPVLLILTPSRLHVYSGLTPPKETSPRERLIESLTRATQALDIRTYALGIANGDLFRRKSESFPADQRVEKRLLRNLQAARQALLDAGKGTAEAVPIEVVDRLLCRVVFTSYLIDRGVLGEGFMLRTPAQKLNRPADLFRLWRRTPARAGKRLFERFRELRTHFNGDLFDGDLDKEETSLSDTHWQILCDWLTGTETDSGQLSFIDYDFRVLPIETISAIYEHFLTPAEKERHGAIYTPRIPAEMVLDMALDAFNNPADLLCRRYLDPACGSGIFLVGLFQRLAEAHRRQYPLLDYEQRYQALVVILTTRLVGIDMNPTACRVAAFSLYLALLDHLEPPNIAELQRRGHMLPPLLHNPEAKDEPNGKTLFGMSFGQVNPAALGKFDIIVGNPPWVSRTGKSVTTNDDDMWPYFNQRLPQAARQLAHRFLFHAPQYLTRGGLLCFLLPWGLLFNRQGIKVQRALLSKYSVDRIVNLCDLHYTLFEDAIHPALIVRYRNIEERLGSKGAGSPKIDYWAPKADLGNLRVGTIEISADDRHRIDPASIMRELEGGRLPTHWKEYLWATPRDRRLLSLLSSYPRLGDRTKTWKELVRRPGQRERMRDPERPWTLGQGFKPESKNSPGLHDPWPAGTLFIKARDRHLELLVLPRDCSPLDARAPRLHRRPEGPQFDPPHVLISIGLKAAYCDFHVVFQHAIRGIHGPAEDTKLLMFLAAYVNTDLARYFLFHTGSYQGQERGKVEDYELLRLPFPLPDDLPQPAKGRDIVGKVASLMLGAKKRLELSDFGRTEVITEIKTSLQELVFEYFDLLDNEKILIEDTIRLALPSATPNPNSRRRQVPPSLTPVSAEQRVQYITLLCSTLNEWASGGMYRMIPVEHLVAEAAGVAVLAFRRVSGELPQASIPPEQMAAGTLPRLLAQLQKKAGQQVGAFYLRRELGIVQDDTLYLIKPLTQRYWSRTAALNDADQIFSSIVQASRRAKA